MKRHRWDSGREFSAPLQDCQSRGPVGQDKPQALAGLEMMRMFMLVWKALPPCFSRHEGGKLHEPRLAGGLPGRGTLTEVSAWKRVLDSVCSQHPGQAALLFLLHNHLITLIRAINSAKEVRMCRGGEREGDSRPGAVENLRHDVRGSRGRIGVPAEGSSETIKTLREKGERGITESVHKDHFLSQQDLPAGTHLKGLKGE